MPPVFLKPDLIVEFDDASCATYPENGTRILLKVRVINQGTVAAQPNFFTDVNVDGLRAAGAPHLTIGPLFTSQVFHLNLAAALGMHAITAFTDSTSAVNEANEDNNSVRTRVWCPQPPTRGPLPVPFGDLPILAPRGIGGVAVPNRLAPP